jgi:hypothetical protein
MRVTADGQNDEKVPCYGDQVHPQKQPKEDLFLLCLSRESQEEELCDCSLIVSIHVCGDERVIIQKDHMQTFQKKTLYISLEEIHLG